MSTPVRASARLRRRAALLLAAALATTSIATLRDAAPADAMLANEIRDETPRIHGAVTVLGDSVLQGGFLYSPTIVQRLAEQGWGPIRGRAGVGYSTGAFTTSSIEAKVTFWIQSWRSQGWDAPNVLINLGANDSGRCDRSVSCARNAILTLVDEIGPGKQVWWPQITRHPLFQHQADAWNQALREIAAERAEFHTWDWPAVMAARGYSSPDNTHLSPSGYRERSTLMAADFTATLAQAQRTGEPAPLPVAAGAPSEVVPIGPVRVLDTREGSSGRIAPDTAIVVDVAEHVPPGTTAVAAYVSATNTNGDGFLTAYDCDSARPLASAANHKSGKTRGAVAITPVSADGTFCLYTLAEADLLVDLQAAFVPSGGLRFDPLAVPQRLIDTRETGRADILELEVSDGAEAVAVSLTAVFPDVAGFLTAYPCTDEIPLVATVNYGPGELISGTAFLPVGPDGSICVFVFGASDVTVDLTGTFAADASLEFVPAPPTRTLDTRTGVGGWSPVHGADQTLDTRVAPPAAVAVSGTLTMVGPARGGFTRAWGCGTEPPTANVTAIEGVVLANHVTTGVSAFGELCFYTPVPSNTVFDTNGWWVPAS